MDKRLYHPRYWGIWLLVGVLRLLVALPWRWQIKTGVRLTRMAYPFLKRRKHIARTNLRIAFPDKSEAEIESLCQKSFDHIGATAAESLIAWLMPDRRFKKIPFTLHNREEFDRLHADPDQSVLLLGCHCTALEMVGRYIATYYKPFYLVYQKHKHPLMEYLIRRGRERQVHECLERRKIMPIVKALKNKHTLWYAPDQDFGYQHTVFVPFFHRQCATLTATSWLVQRTGANVIPVYYVRRDDFSGYDAYASPSWSDFPSGDAHADARRYNEWLESVIRQYPEQYLWQHRRFKTRPPGEPKIY